MIACCGASSQRRLPTESCQRKRPEPLPCRSFSGSAAHHVPRHRADRPEARVPQRPSIHPGVQALFRSHPIRIPRHAGRSRLGERSLRGPVSLDGRNRRRESIIFGGIVAESTRGTPLRPLSSHTAGSIPALGGSGLSKGRQSVSKWTRAEGRSPHRLTAPETVAACLSVTRSFVSPHENVRGLEWGREHS